MLTIFEKSITLIDGLGSKSPLKGICDQILFNYKQKGALAIVKPWNNINLNFQSSSVKQNSNENKLWTNLIHHIKLQAQTVLHSITVSSKCMKFVAIIWEIFHPKLNLLDKNTSEPWQELLDTQICYERFVPARN